MIEADVAVAQPLKRAILREIHDLSSRHAIEGHRLWTDPPLDAQNLPILLVGGLSSTAWQLQVIRDWLVRLRCQVRISPVGYGVGCGERTTQRVTESLIAHAGETGRRCVLIAHSRGGQFARAAAVRHPELVEALIVLGSPINRLVGVHPLLKAPVALLALGGTLGLPGLFRSTCLWGQCCRRLRADLQGPFPEGVPFLSVYSRHDVMVDWRSTLDPAATHREIDASHGGLLCSATAFEAVADELARVVGRRRVDGPGRSVDRPGRRATPDLSRPGRRQPQPGWGARAAKPAPIQTKPAAAA